MGESKQRHANECVHSAPFGSRGKKKKLESAKHHSSGHISVSWDKFTVV